MSQTVSPASDLRFPCKQCGAKLEFAPGTESLKCPYCGVLNQIERVEANEQDLAEYLRRLEESKPHESVPVVVCDTCAAQVSVPDKLTSFSCPFCSSNIVSPARECSIVRPNAVLPFKLTREQATESYRRWLASLWWAPNTLKQRGMLDASLSGIYLPHWTFDAIADTSYTGERGDAYYETQWVTVNGQRRQQQVRKVRWTPVSGRVRDSFDDLLVPASTSLDQQKVRELTPWDLNECVAYQESYLAGFRAERYTVPLQQGFSEAQARMEQVIVSSIRRDIGGDEQRIHQKRTRYGNLTFKHVLLPIWVSAYRYRAKVYRFLVNARTGEVQGERPYSAVKIGIAVVLALLFLLCVVLLLART